MIYPQKLNSKKSEKILQTLINASIILAIILVIINKLISPQIPWSAITNCGIIYIWITIIYSIKRNTNIAGHVLLQTIIVSGAMVYIDEKIGFRGWSIQIAIPIVLIVANITMLILTVVSYKKYIKYAIYQLVICLLPVILITTKVIELNILGKIANGISIFNLLITLILCYRDVKEAIVRNIHM